MIPTYSLVGMGWNHEIWIDCCLGQIPKGKLLRSCKLRSQPMHPFAARCWTTLCHLLQVLRSSHGAFVDHDKHGVPASGVEETPPVHDQQDGCEWYEIEINRVKQYETILNSATGELKLDPSLYLLRVMQGCWAILTRLRTGANTRQTPRRFTRATPQHVRHVAEFRGVGKSQWSPCFRGHWEEDTVMDDVPLRITRTGTSNPEAENSTRWCSLGCSTFSSAIFRGRFPALVNWHWLHVMSAALLLFMPHFVCLLSSEQFLNCSLSVTCSLNFITIYNTI